MLSSLDEENWLIAKEVDIDKRILPNGPLSLPFLIYLFSLLPIDEKQNNLLQDGSGS